MLVLRGDSPDVKNEGCAIHTRRVWINGNNMCLGGSVALTGGEDQLVFAGTLVERSSKLVPAEFWGLFVFCLGMGHVLCTD